MINQDLNNIVVTVDYFNHRICTPTWNIQNCKTDFVDITYILSGHAEYSINNKKVTVSPGDLLCIPTDSQRSAISCPDALMECYSINGFIRDINGNDVDLPLPLIGNIGLQEDIIGLYSDLNTLWQLREPGYILKARSIYMMILQRFFQVVIYKKDSISLDKRIQKVLHYMSHNYMHPLTVQGMAKMVNLSDMYFGNLFKKETGLSFRKFLNIIRLNRAEEMLYSREYKISEIADACGFCDEFYFSKLYKKSRGYSPSKASQRNNHSLDDDFFLYDEI